MILIVVFAVAAAFSNAVNLMTQHAASAGAPKREKSWRLVGYLFRQPLWLLGWIAAVAGFAFQALALHRGQLSVVQPILVTELVFVLVLRRLWIGQDVARAAWAAVLAVCVALAVFLTVAEPTGGHPAPEAAEWLSALLAFGGAIVLLAVLGRRGSPARRAALFAVAAALAWALMATFIKTATRTLTEFGTGGMLTRWPVYALAAAAVTGTLLEQSALHLGPLSVSQPLLVVIDPFAATTTWRTRPAGP
jgi:drug/metabolite transporter (DMT)-like permease